MNTTVLASNGTLTLNEGYFARRDWGDWLFALLAVVGALFAFQQYHGAMDVYEKSILVGAVPMVIWLGWFWRPLRNLMLVVAALGWWFVGPGGQPAAAPAQREADAAALRDPALIARGEYLATLGDCAACHTAQGGQRYAGGRSLGTPFGDVPTISVTRYVCSAIVPP